MISALSAERSVFCRMYSFDAFAIASMEPIAWLSWREMSKWQCLKNLNDQITWLNQCKIFLDNVRPIICQAILQELAWQNPLISCMDFHGSLTIISFTDHLMWNQGLIVEMLCESIKQKGRLSCQEATFSF